MRLLHLCVAAAAKAASSKTDFGMLPLLRITWICGKMIWVDLLQEVKERAAPRLPRLLALSELIG